MSIIEYFGFLVEGFTVLNSATYWLLGGTILFAYIGTKWVRDEYKYSCFPWHVLLREFIKTLIWFLLFYYILVLLLSSGKQPEKCLYYHSDTYNYDTGGEGYWCITIDTPQYYFGTYDVDKAIENKFKLNCPVRGIEESTGEWRALKTDPSPWQKNYYLPGDRGYPDIKDDRAMNTKFFCSEEEAIASGYTRREK